MELGVGALLANTGRMIAEIRRAQGISQEQLGDLCLLHRNTVGKLERGEVDPSLSVVNRVFVQIRAGGVLFNGDGVIAYGLLTEGLSRTYGEVTPAQSLGQIAACVRTLRKHNGLSLEALARAADVHINTIWGFENRIVDPSLMTTYKVYRALGVDNVSLEEDGLKLRRALDLLVSA